MKLCRVPLLDLVEVAAISVVRVGGFAVAELGEFLRKLVFVFDRHGIGRFVETAIGHSEKASEAEAAVSGIPVVVVLIMTPL